MQFFKKKKNKAEKKTCTRVEFGPSKIDVHSMVTVLFFPNAQDMHFFPNAQGCTVLLFFPMHKICTRYAQKV